MVLTIGNLRYVNDLVNILLLIYISGWIGHIFMTERGSVDDPRQVSIC